MTLSLERSGRLDVRSVPWVHLALFAGVLVVYMLTLAPGALGGDAGEYQFVPYILSMTRYRFVNSRVRTLNTRSEPRARRNPSESM